MLTSRHLSYDNWVHSTGHADLFQLPDGRWYMVLLGIRADAGPGLDRRSNMGRETLLVPVEWEREPMEWSPLGPPMRHLWPVAAPRTGRVERLGPVPFQGTEQGGPHYFRDDFAEAALHPEWNFRRVPRPGAFSLAARPGFLRLFARPEQIEEYVACSLMGVRQRESDFEYKARMEFSAGEGSAVEAGISLFQKDDNYINWTLARSGADWVLRLSVARPGQEARCAHLAPVPGYKGSIVFRVVADSDGYHFSYSLAPPKMPFLQLAGAVVAEPDVLVSKGYTGAYLGLYCTTAGAPACPDRDFADFDWIQHEARPGPVADEQPGGA